jgi:single-stranded-DNA-specific exonuclease
MKWQLLNNRKVQSVEEVVELLLKNREINNSEEFFNPTDPKELTLKSIGIDKKEIEKAIARINKAKENNELVFIYGDYDADGICATAILWESLNKMGVKVLPHIPDRFEEGYGLNPESIQNLKQKNPNLGLIITVDNGIVAYEGLKKVKELNLDAIVMDHHTKGEEKLNAMAVIHTTILSGSGIAWIFARELLGKDNINTLELAVIGTVADQIPLTGPNRSIVKYGLLELTVTKRPGLKALFDDSALTAAGMLIKPLTTYEIGYIIAPRINAMGRLKHGIESLRLLCTRDRFKAVQIARNVGLTNQERQKIVEEVLIATRLNINEQKIIVVSGETFHEGVIGLAAGRLTEEFSRPAIVFSVKGEISKASARSVPGFNIIEEIRKLKKLYLEGGGHPMAAGFSIPTKNIPLFAEEINKSALTLLTDEVLEKKLKIDLAVTPELIDFPLLNKIKQFEPVGLGNPAPVFSVTAMEVVEIKTVGKTAKHLKLKLSKNGKIFEAIYFGGGEMLADLGVGFKINAAFNIEDNNWNGYKNLQLKIKDIKF